MKLRKSSHGIAYRIIRLVVLGFYIASIGVLIHEAKIPSKASGAKSTAAGIAISNIINDFNGDVAIEIIPEACEIVISKTEFNVGESTTIKVATYPEETSYQSYIYTSSNPSIADINEYGDVNFLTAGTAQIKAENTKNPEVFATVDVTVKVVELESFTSKINATLKDGVYQLEVGSSYVVTNTFKPSNATYKTVSYEYDETLEYIDLNDDTVTALKTSNDNVFNLVVKCGIFTNTLKLKTIKKEPVVEDYPLEGLKASNVTKYVDQTSEFTPSITYTPSYVSSKYKGYSLSSGNTSVVTVVNGTKLKPTGTIGTSVITATSTYDSAFTATFTVKVIDRPTLVSVTISKYSSTMYVGKTQTLSVSTSPSSNLSITKTFTSSNPSAASVSSTGVVTGKAEGTTTITVSVKDKVHNITKTASVNISVVEPPVYIVNDIEIGYKHGECPVLHADAQTNLKDYFYIKSFAGNTNPTNKDYKFYIDLSLYPGTLEDDIRYTPAMNGQVFGQLYYVNENSVTISKDISFVVASDFNILDEDNDPTSNMSIYVKQREQISIKTLTSYYQSYKVTNLSSDTISITYSGGVISVYAKQSGSASFKVTPVLTVDETSIEITDFAKTISVTTNERYTTAISLKFYDSKKNEVEMSDTEVNTIYVNQTFTYKAILDTETTLSSVSVKSSNECVEIKNNTVIPKKIGETVIYVKDKYSGLMTEYKVKVRNRVLINEKKVYLIYGICSFDVETNTLSIVNGDYAQVRYNFDAGTTFRKVNYKIEDESIAVVGQDGMVTPKKVGQTTLTMEIHDELSSHATSTINVVVVRRNFIQNMTEFLRQVRKALGHFGAFAMLGILGTIAFFMFFRKDLYLFGQAISISIGYFVAALTEEIQRHTPGRAAKMSDVVIDMRGYFIGVAIVTIILALIFGIKLLIKVIKKRKAKKAEKS